AHVPALHAPFAAHAVRPPLMMPQGCPAEATPIAVQTLVSGAQNSPLRTSQLPKGFVASPGVHAAPASSGAAHVPFLHASVLLHGCVASHVAPEVPGATQAPCAARAGVKQISP